MIEEPINYGEQGRGLAIATIPDNAEAGAPLVLLFNAGLLNRSGPFRLNVLLARKLAAVGCICVRVDWSGRGDTPARDGLTPREFVSKDWGFVKQQLINRFGERPLVFMGLCSGADNAFKIAANEEDTRALILLDPVVPIDPGFKYRFFVQKYTDINRWKNVPRKFLNVVLRLLGRQKKTVIDLGELRDLPREDEIETVFSRLKEHQGKAMAVFTSYSLNYYNLEGQWSRVPPISDFDQVCDEFFWPHMDHVYITESHRNYLVDTVAVWMKENLAAISRA